MIKRLFKSLRNRITEGIYRLFRFPVNLYFNFRMLPVSQAVRLPFFIGYGVSLRELHRGNIMLSADIVSKYMISIGRGGSEGIPVRDRGAVSFAPGAKIEFQGTAQFHKGSRLFLGDKADVTILRSTEIGSHSIVAYGSTITGGSHASSTVPMGPFLCFAIMISAIPFLSVSLL